MQYYSKNYSKSTLYSTHLPTNFENCSPLSRCHDYKKCPHCKEIQRKKEFSKATKHLTEKHLKNYKHKSFITITCKETDLDADTKNMQIDFFIKDLLRSKRYEKSCLHKGQYFIGKHVSYSNENGVNPHLHMILLSNKSFKHDKYIKKYLERYNLELHHRITTRDKDNSYKTSILKQINYILKAEKDRFNIEQISSLTKGKRDIKKSVLFSKRQSKKDKRLYNHIQEVRANFKKKRALAIKIFKNFNKTKPKTYIRMHKSLHKKLKLYKKQERTQISRLQRSDF